MRKRNVILILLTISALCLTGAAFAMPAGIEALTVTGDAKNGQTYSVTLQILVLMTLLTLLPAMLLTMTAFTLIMMPVFDKVNVEAVQPYMEEKIDAMQAIEKASIPFRQFMLKQTRESDLELFVRISGKAELENANAEQIPFSLLLPAYVTSEIKTAFQIGFLIFLPFLIIDLVVASVLMSMGMMMLSPMVISLPFKIMLFVLADGWSLIMEMLAASFFVGT
jgi:flagellar biosynthetic protein FliP